MNKDIKKIYDMLYSPILTPYNLLENAKLDNYEYVTYYSNDIGLVAEMKCTVDGGETEIFYYQFDKENHLQRIYQKNGDTKDVVFDRGKEVKKAKDRYYNHSSIIEPAS
ncbi:hypothetical protein [Pectinatus frisingensis]|uniref:hypothetical protein n=1 Tax=Pectinatus frisingensis TaxID=865 RepID=UPI0018C47172|nr:hypothetical protein [Pectinatus frisingensis]